MNKMPKGSTNTQEVDFYEEGFIAFQEAVDEVMLEHQRLNIPLWIKRNGKLEAVSAVEILKEKKGMNS